MLLKKNFIKYRFKTTLRKVVIKTGGRIYEDTTMGTDERKERVVEYEKIYGLC